MKNNRKSRAPSTTERSALLVERRNLKMARSAQAYVRGNTMKFYEWLEDGEHGLPQGPPVWICGDCHVGNLGPVANTKGHIEIQIRDLDQSVIGNPAHDLIRLALSLATAARGSDLPGVSTAKMMESLIEGYVESLVGFDEIEATDTPEPMQRLMKDALKRQWKHLARERIDNPKPTIPFGKRFWKLSREEDRAIRKLFATESVHQLLTAVRHRDDDSPVELLDAAYWVKGCSSLGRLRYAVLARVGKDDVPENYCLIDIKEAIAAAAPRYPRVRMPRGNAERVVAGARQLAPHLGERMLATQLLGRSVFLRELFPQDLKLELDRVDHADAQQVARFLASVVGRAHARQLSADDRQAWQRELMGRRSRKLDAPSWLWSSVVELVASHEAGYLEHCRRYALSDAAAEKCD